MKLYKVKSGIVLETAGKYYFDDKTSWDELFRETDVISRLRQSIATGKAISAGQEIIDRELEAPIESQEIWASGVTYYNSKLGRQEESKNTGGGQFYAHVYEAERPELFFKALAQRTVGHKGLVRIRRDSTWDVPEPELTLAISSRGRIFGYTIGNDMSSRSIEGENPLYLPQAKTYEGCAALGPCIFISHEELPAHTGINLEILRSGKTVFEGRTDTGQMKRRPEDLVSFLFRECMFPNGCFLMTGTGIVPGHEFTLRREDEIRISIQPIGTLINKVG
jgi:2-dehydro-3-deoxy-D-arabinonate dehydratase